VVDSAGLESRDKELATWRSRYAELEARAKRLEDGPVLDMAAARSAGFAIQRDDQLEIIEGIGPKIADVLRNAGVRRFWQLSRMSPAQIRTILDAAGPTFKLANPGTWPEQAGLAANNHWVSLQSLQLELDAGVRVAGVPAAAAPKAAPAPAPAPAPAVAKAAPAAAKPAAAFDKSAAKAAGFTVRKEDDLEVVEGIGPKIHELLRAAGIKTWMELAATKPAQIQKILDTAGPKYKLAVPDTWPEQSGLAGKGKWAELKALQESLDGGRRN
jgi:predicted flap endonuclease-1-like 5' DNA nuclease